MTVCPSQYRAPSALAPEAKTDVAIVVPNASLAMPTRVRRHVAL